MDAQDLLAPSAMQSCRIAARPLSNAQLRRALDTILDNWLGSGCALAALPDLLDVTHRWRAFAATPDWRAVARAHPIAERLMQDPLTHAAFHRPPGHRGDAALLDMILDHPAGAEPSAIGQDIRLFTHGAEACVALRERRRVIAQAIDDTVRRVGDPEILALGCGHLRELELARHAGAARRIVALDAVAETLDVAAAAHAGLRNLRLFCERPARLMLQPLRHGGFDLIHAAGLLECLDDAAAARLVAALFQALKPGGRLILGNLASSIRCDGYMDAFMDWRLELRGVDDMATLLDGLASEGAARSMAFCGGNGAMVYGVVTRRG